MTRARGAIRASAAERPVAGSRGASALVGRRAMAFVAEKPKKAHASRHRVRLRLGVASGERARSTCARAERSPRPRRRSSRFAPSCGPCGTAHRRQLRRAKAEVKETLALGVEEEVGLVVDLGQPHAVTGVDLQAGEPAHLRLKNHLALTCEVVDARVGEGGARETTTAFISLEAGKIAPHTRGCFDRRGEALEGFGICNGDVN